MDEKMVATWDEWKLQAKTENLLQKTDTDGLLLGCWIMDSSEFLI